MRDLLILSIVLAVAGYSLRKPWIGAVAGVLVSLMSPHMEFGYNAAGWPVAQIIAIGTLLGALITKDRQNPVVGTPVVWFLAFWVWTCVTLPFSFYFDLAIPLWLRSMKIFLLVLVALILVSDKRRLDVLIWCIVVALGFYGVKGGVFTLVTGGNFRVWGPGGFVEGNNELALALISMLPLMYYLLLQSKSRWVRRGLLVSMLILPVTILGSHSRGAFVALAVMTLVMWIKSDRKVVWGFGIVAMAPLVLSVMPEHWWTRMETIQTYEDDGSAMGRINAWWNAWNVARSNFFGAGFYMYTPEVFERYSPNPEAVHAAHSIYFQVLGEHGFAGLILFMGIGASTLWSCWRMERIAKANPQVKWVGQLGAMLTVSILGFAAGGAFLSLAYFDFLYYQMAIVALGLAFARRQIAADGALSPSLPQRTSGVAHDGGKSTPQLHETAMSRR